MTLAEQHLLTEFTVLGRPQQKGSKRSVWRPRKGGGINIYQVDANEKAKPWQRAVQLAAYEASGGAVLYGPVMVTLRFYFPRPRGHYGTGSNAQRLRASAPLEMTTMPDIDKLVRTALDGLTGALIGDDRQVVQVLARKSYDEPERLEVAVMTL